VSYKNTDKRKLKVLYRCVCPVNGVKPRQFHVAGFVFRQRALRRTSLTGFTVSYFLSSSVN
jgi:hypothetical protein